MNRLQPLRRQRRIQLLRIAASGLASPVLVLLLAILAPTQAAGAALSVVTCVFLAAAILTIAVAVATPDEEVES